MIRIAARNMIAGVLLLAIVLASFAVPASAQGPAKSLQDRLIGHWQLVTVTINGRTPYGANPSGSMFLDAGGHFAVVVVSVGGARSVAYFGTYTIDAAAGAMTMHIDGSTGGGAPNAAGRVVKRLIVLSGDELTVQNQTRSGAPGAVKATWKQAN